MMTSQFGEKHCAAEILTQACTRLGRRIRSDDGWRPMTLADAIADVSINNAPGACDAFKALHDATGEENLAAWANGQSNEDIAAFVQTIAWRMLK